MRPLTLETTLSTRLRVDEWQYFYVEPLAAGQTADDSSKIFADMEITSNPVNLAVLSRHLPRCLSCLVPYVVAGNNSVHFNNLFVFCAI
jgi:hypothetical protein